MKIGILQTGHAPEEMKHSHGNYDAMFHQLLDGHGFTFETFSVVDGIFPSAPDVADGWLITGSKHGAYEDHAWIPPLEDLIRQIAERKQPLVGICFGHQIIAQALGGTVEKFSGGWAVGRTEYELEGETVSLNAWHQDQVVKRPASARVAGRNDFCENAMLAYGDHIWTVQPHPEFDGGFIDGLIQHRGSGVVPEHQLAAAKSQLEAPVNNADLATRIATFFTLVRA